MESSHSQNRSMSKSLFRASTRLLLTTALVLGSCFTLAKSVLAQTTPAGTSIPNLMNGSFEGVTSLTSNPLNSNSVTFEVTTPIASNPKLLLVKRITAINGVAITTVVNDGVASSADDNANWVAGYLKGDITRNDVVPSDRIEYTIYFLSAGDTDITGVTICDLIPTNTTFVNNAYDVVGGGSNLGIVFANSAPISYLTGLFDGDRGKFYPANTIPPTTCKKPTTNATLTDADNKNGIVVVDVANRIPLPLPAIVELIPFATGVGSPTNSYGFVRFTVRVN